MARRSRFPRLDEHHLGVEVTFIPKDETEQSLLQAIGAAEDTELLKATLHLPLYQIERSAQEVLIRNGVPQSLFSDVKATLQYVRTHFASDSEPTFAANLLVQIGAIQMQSHPHFLTGALYMFSALKLFYEMRREFGDGPSLAREAAQARGRSDGGNEKRRNEMRWRAARDNEIRSAYEAARLKDPHLKESVWANGQAGKWPKHEFTEDRLGARSIREILRAKRNSGSALTTLPND